MNQVPKTTAFIVVFGTVMFLAAVIAGVAVIAGAPGLWVWGYFTGAGLTTAFTTSMGIAGMKRNEVEK